MEKEKQEIKKIPKLRVYPKTTVEGIHSKLQKLLQIKEFRLDVSYCDIIELVLKLVSSFLREQKELTRLEIEIKSVSNLNLDSTLYLLKDLTAITDLTISFPYLENCKSFQRLSLSQCFVNYTNLTRFCILINCKFLDNKQKVFSLYELYSRNPNIKQLKIRITDLNEKSTLYYSILEGISLLTELENLDVDLSQIRSQTFGIINCLKEELKEKKNLKQLRLYFGWVCFIDYSEFKLVNEILKDQIDLENLEIINYSSRQIMKVSEMGFESSLGSLTNLKVLKLELNDKWGRQFNSVIETISSMKQLEKVILRFSIDNFVGKDENLELFGQSLAKIQNLNQLFLSFNYLSNISYNYLIKFITGFHELENLNELGIFSSCVKYLNYKKLQDKTQLFKVFSKLKTLSWYVYASDLKQDIEDDIVDAVRSAKSIEKITLFIKDDRMSGNEFVHNHKFFQSIFDNKKKLKQLSIQYPLSQGEDNQNCYVLERLIQNTQLNSLNLSFKNQMKNSLPLLSQLSRSLISFQDLKELEIEFSSSFILNDSGFFLFTTTLRQIVKLIKLNITIDKDGLQIKTLNEFTSTLQYLKKLSYLDLKITGTQFKDEEEQVQFAKYFKLPTKILFMNVKLEISGLKFKKIQDIFKNVSDISRLEYLYFYLKDFSITLFESIQFKNYLSNLKQLKTIWLNHYSLNLLHLVDLFQEIKTLHKINFLNSYHGLISCIVIATRKTKLCTKNNQQEILSKGEEQEGNQLEEKISLSVKNHYLFEKNEFENDDYESLSYLFNSLASLTKLVLYIHKNNNIGNAFFNVFFNQLESLQNLTYFNLEIQPDNFNGSDSLNCLGKALVSLPRLQKLFLIIHSTQNKIDWLQCTDFMISLGNLCTLVQFEIQLNFEFTYDQSRVESYHMIIIKLFQSILNMVKLKSLKISLISVALNDLCFDELKSTLRSLKKLFNLTLILDIKSDHQNQELQKGICLCNNVSTLTLNEIKQQQIYHRKLKKLVKLQKKPISNWY